MLLLENRKFDLVVVYFSGWFSAFHGRMKINFNTPDLDLLILAGYARKDQPPY